MTIYHVYNRILVHTLSALFGKYNIVLSLLSRLFTYRFEYVCLRVFACVCVLHTHILQSASLHSG
jgi:hypothetical protein